MKFNVRSWLLFLLFFFIYILLLLRYKQGTIDHCGRLHDFNLLICSSLSLFLIQPKVLCIEFFISFVSHCCKTSVLISWHAAYLSIEFIQFKLLIKSNVKLLVNRGTSFLFKIAKIVKIN